MKHRILLVDDDILTLNTTRRVLENDSYTIDTAQNGSEAAERIRAFGNDYSLVLLDYRLKDETGASIAKQILQINPNLFVLIYSGDNSRDALKNTWQAGAIGFLEKGQDLTQFRETIRNWCVKHRETRQVLSLRYSFNDNSETIATLKMIGRSSQMAKIAEQVNRYKTLSDNVLIIGETGTGKEKVARALHAGDFSTFFPVNCAAYSANTELMEGELFGYEKGAFTGALRKYRGIFETAKGGTVFLDEVHTLSKFAQQKLLRVIQEKKIRMVGSSREIPFSFRLIAAAKPEIKNRHFLPDLFERLNVLEIEIPPLRERIEDIEPLVAFFSAQFEKESGEKRAFSYRTLRYLEKYHWPRNVRELENTVRRICVNTLSEKIEPEHMGDCFFKSVALPPPSLKSQKDALLTRQIENALMTNPSQRKAAIQLNIPESTLRRQIKRLHITCHLLG